MPILPENEFATSNKLDLNKIMVKPANELETKVCFALFEAAGYKFDCGEKRRLYDCLHIINDTDLFGWGIPDILKVLSIYDFVWSQAPDWATKLCKTQNSLLAWVGDNLCQGIMCSLDYNANTWDNVISERPQSAKPKWNVGDKCKYSGGDSAGTIVVSKPDVRGLLIILDDSDEYIRVYENQLEPYLSERDKLIQRLAGELGYLCPSAEVVNKVVDLGWRPTK